MNIIKTNIPEKENGKWSIRKYTSALHEIYKIYQPDINFNFIENEPEQEYTTLIHSEYGVIMIDSAKEYKEHNLLWEKANGNILIGGLGIGMVNEKLITMQNIETITIIEKNIEVIDMVWPFCKKDDRFILIHDDIDTWNIPENKHWNYAWFDTYISNVNVDYCAYNNTLLTKYSSYCDKIDFWPGIVGK